MLRATGHARMVKQLSVMRLHCSIVFVFLIDGRCARPRFFESYVITLCSRSRCGAREAMTVGCKPTIFLTNIEFNNLLRRACDE